MPRAIELCHGALAGPASTPKRACARHKPWHFLCGLLLGLNALDVRSRGRECRLDAIARRGNGHGEEHVLGTQSEPSVGTGAAWVGNSNTAQSFLFLKKLRLQLLSIS